MDAIHKRMMYLHGKRKHYPFIADEIFSPDYQGNRIVLFPGFRMRNMRKGDPRKRGELINVIPHRCRKIFFLLPHGIGGKGDIFLHGVLHFHIDYFEKLTAFIQISERRIDPVIDHRFSLPKAASEFLDLIRALRHGKYKRKGKGIAPLSDLLQKEIGRASCRERV